MADKGPIANDALSPTVESDPEKYLIFLTGGKRYALLQKIVQEIIIDDMIHFLPFVPEYIRGLINRQAEPYACLDIDYLFHSRKCDGRKFIIIRDNREKISLHIQEVLKIVQIPQKDFIRYSRTVGIDYYFLYAIPLDGENVPVIDISRIIRRVKDDLV